jgi:hypothetical protein
MRERRRPWPQVIDPAQDAREQRPRHCDLGQLKHHVAAMAHDPGADRSVISDQCSTSSGRPKVRMKLAGLYASACSWSRTALCRKAWQLSRVQRSAFLPSLIHCSAVPRPL